MDRDQLTTALEEFRLACIKIGAIQENELSALVFDEVYQGVFIVNVTVENKWLDKSYHPNALKELITLLYDESITNVKTRESILTLRLCKKTFPYDTIEYPTLEDGKPA